MGPAPLTTHQFKKLLQENYQEVLGIDLSMDNAYLLYKASFVSSLQFLMRNVDPKKLEDVRLALGGIGVWRLDFRKPRPIAGKPSKLLRLGVKWIPYFRFSTSSAFRRLLLQKYCGIIEPVPVSKTVKERMHKAEERRRLKAANKSLRDKMLNPGEADLLEPDPLVAPEGSDPDQNV